MAHKSNLIEKNNFISEDNEQTKLSDEYRKLNDKCDLVIKKIKNRKKNKK